MTRRGKKRNRNNRNPRRSNPKAARPATASQGAETEHPHKEDKSSTADDRKPAANDPISVGTDHVHNQSELEQDTAKGNLRPPIDKEPDTPSRETISKERELNDRERKVADREKRLSRKNTELDKWEAEISKREYDAEQGFAIKQKEMYSKLVKEREELRSEIAHEWKKTHDAQLQKRAKVLDNREDQLVKERQDLDAKKRELEWAEQDLNELQEDLEERAKQLAAACIEKLEHRLQSVNVQLEQARSDREKYDLTLQQREEADRKFGQRPPEEILNDITSLREQNEKLKTKIAELPDAEAGERLAVLEKEQETWQTERTDLLREKSNLKRQLAYFNNDANEREVQRDSIKSLNSQRELLFKASKELRLEYDSLLKSTEARVPFPSCACMDSNPDLQASTQVSREKIDLKDFVRYLRNRIAGSKELYYSLPDLRSFVGGLAMGQLILLQGVSGTGKTSLPMEFAHAVGTEPEVVEVQAGWRDPQDLVGHYNSFEKKFDEKKFLQALYRAGTPRWQDAICIVLLDEMNLSHPEQYFSDLLSAMELDPEKQRLVLMSHAVDPAPQQFIDGSKLHVPPNVWFVGTANHDETTMAFAPKTYDRSHVLELPLVPERFKVERTPPCRSFSYKALQWAFDDAVKKHHSLADQAIKFLEDEMREMLADNFEVGWGPRLTQQMRRYVPVVIAAGGRLGEATDRVLAMRILRKLKDRYDNQPAHLEELKRKIEGSWQHLDSGSNPEHSLTLLDSELKRVGHDPEDA